MTPLNLVYGAEEGRSWWQRFLVSLALAVRGRVRDADSG